MVFSSTFSIATQFSLFCIKCNYTINIFKNDGSSQSACVISNCLSSLIDLIIQTCLIKMDPLFKALSYFHVKKYQESIDICTECLQKNPYDQVSVLTKTKKNLESLNINLKKRHFGH